NPEQQICAAIVAGEVNGAADARARLDRINREHLEERFRDDISALQQIYSGSEHHELSTTQAAALRKDLKWYGELALSFGQSAGSPERSAALKPAMRAMVAILVL